MYVFVYCWSHKSGCLEVGSVGADAVIRLTYFHTRELRKSIPRDMVGGDSGFITNKVDLNVPLGIRIGGHEPEAGGYLIRTDFSVISRVGWVCSISRREREGGTRQRCWVASPLSRRSERRANTACQPVLRLVQLGHDGHQVSAGRQQLLLRLDILQYGTHAELLAATGKP